MAWCGAGAAVGAVCWTATSLLEPVVLGTRPYEATPFDVVKLVSWVLMTGGLAGVPAALGNQYGRLSRIGVKVAAVGMILVAGLHVRAVVVLALAGFQAVPSTGENIPVLVAAYGGYSLAIGGAGLLGIALWRSSDRPTITAVLLVLTALIPALVVLPYDVLPAIPRMLLLRSNNLLVPFGVAWVALGFLVHSRASD